jgi:transcriptional regulator with XRE-family HTH domain
MMTIGNRVREMREARGWSQTELAGGVEITPGEVADLERCVALHRPRHSGQARELERAWKGAQTDSDDLDFLMERRMARTLPILVPENRSLSKRGQACDSCDTPRPG